MGFEVYNDLLYLKIVLEYFQFCIKILSASGDIEFLEESL